MKLGFLVENFDALACPNGLSLKGQRVDLVPLNADLHASSLYDANALDEDGQNWTYLPYGPFNTQADYSSWIQGHQDQDDPTFFAIVRKSDGRAIGVASYLRISPTDRSIEVGHICFSPLLQRTALATEAMFLMMSWAFDQGYRRYEWKCNALNAASRKAAQRLGFSYEGVFRQATVTKGLNRDTAWFAMIDKEWPALKQCFETYLADSNYHPDGRSKQSLSALTKPLLYKLDTFEAS